MAYIPQETIDRIKKKLRSHGVEPDTIDWKAEWDSDQSFDTNWEHLKSTYNIRERQTIAQREYTEAQTNEHNFQGKKEENEKKKENEREGRASMTPEQRANVVRRQEYTQQKEVVIPEKMFQGRKPKKNYREALKNAAKKIGHEVKYVAHETGHIATHDLAPASSKVLVRTESGKIVQKLKREFTGKERVVGRYKEIYSPFPNAAFGRRRQFLQAHYGNPIGQTSLLMGKLYKPRMISSIQASQSIRKKKRRTHVYMNKPKWAF